MESIMDTGTRSKNSQTAKSGFDAEGTFRTSPAIRAALESHFGRQMASIEAAPHGKKSDNVIVFADGSRANVQNKLFSGFGGRGDSFDRRAVSKTFDGAFHRKYLTALTLFRPTKRTSNLSNEQKQQFETLCRNSPDDVRQYLRKTLIGTDENKNEFWVFMQHDKTDGDPKVWVVESETLYRFLEGSIKISAKNTCLHLSDNVYLQRKGGSKGESSPNDIQAKLKITEKLIAQCTRVL